jgi:hypothetical protein
MTRKPPLRPVDIRILAIHPLIMMHASSRIRDLGPAWGKHAIEGIPSGRHDFGHQAGERRPYPQAFFDACLKVGHLLRFSVADDRGGDPAGGNERVDFGAQSGVYARVCDDMQESGAHGGCGRVGAGHAGSRLDLNIVS